MKILVVDDEIVHRQAAEQTLAANHDLTVVGNHDEALNAIQRENWDAVLCDLLMPAGKKAQGGPGLQYVGVEMSVGWSLAIHAALRGAEYVAVATDMNHHHHPASAMLDGMDHTVFDINGAKVLFTNHVRMINVEGYDDQYGKDWSSILQQLIEEDA